MTVSLSDSSDMPQKIHSLIVFKKEGQDSPLVMSVLL